MTIRKNPKSTSLTKNVNERDHLRRPHHRHRQVPVPALVIHHPVTVQVHRQIIIKRRNGAKSTVKSLKEKLKSPKSQRNLASIGDRKQFFVFLK
jgi:hypothetical protein